MNFNSNLKFLTFWSLVLLLACLSTIDAVAFKRLTYFQKADFWEHVAAVHVWSQDLLSPENPQVATNEATSRYMPYFFLVSCVASIFNLPAVNSLYLFGVINVILFCIFWGRFLRDYFSSDWAPAIGLLTFFFCWGKPWYWSNIYSIQTFPTLGSYPSSFVLWMTPLLWTLCFSERYSGHRFWRTLFLPVIALLTFTVVLTHLLTAVLALYGAGLLVMLRLDLNWRRRLEILLVISIGALLSVLWPYYNIMNLISSGSSISTTIGVTQWYGLQRVQQIFQHDFYRPVAVAIAIGPAFVGSIAMASFIAQRRQWFLVIGGCFFGFIYVVNIFYAIPLGHRALIFLIIFFHLSIVAIMIDRTNYTQHWESLIWKICSISVIFSIVFNLGLITRSLLRDAKRDNASISDVYQAIAMAVPENTVVMAKPAAAWPIPAFGGKIVSLWHPNPLVRDLSIRNRDNLAFFDDQTTDEHRIELIKKYNITHILLENGADEQILSSFLSRYSHVKLKFGKLKMFKVHFVSDNED